MEDLNFFVPQYPTVAHVCYTLLCYQVHHPLQESWMVNVVLTNVISFLFFLLFLFILSSRWISPVLIIPQKSYGSMLSGYIFIYFHDLPRSYNWCRGRSLEGTYWPVTHREYIPSFPQQKQNKQRNPRYIIMRELLNEIKLTLEVTRCMRIAAQVWFYFNL